MCILTEVLISFITVSQLSTPLIWYYIMVTHINVYHLHMSQQATKCFFDFVHLISLFVWSLPVFLCR